MRECIRRKQRVGFTYLDLNNKKRQRSIRPIALISFSPISLLAGWCELRQEFRNFRLDRISNFNALPSHFTDEKDKSLTTYLKLVEQEQL